MSLAEKLYRGADYSEVYAVVYAVAERSQGQLDRTPHRVLFHSAASRRASIPRASDNYRVVYAVAGSKCLPTSSTMAAYHNVFEC